MKAADPRMSKQQIAEMLNDPLLSTKEAAKYLGVCTETITNWRRVGRIAFVRLGYRSMRFRRSELDRYINERTLKIKIGPQPDSTQGIRERQCHGSAKAAAAPSS